MSTPGSVAEAELAELAELVARMDEAAAAHIRGDVDRSYASGDLAVLVGVERQHGEVGGLPDQDWSLRVTLVVRRVGERWRLLHRHADPLGHAIPFDHCARIARGLDPDAP